MNKAEIEQLPEVLRSGQVCQLLNIRYPKLTEMVREKSLPVLNIPGIKEMRFRKSNLLKMIGLTQ